MAGFRGELDRLREALLVGDSEYLTAGRVDALLEVVPSKQELALVQAHVPQPGERLGEVESFFLAVADVPRIERRLLVLRMKHAFSGAIGSLKRAVRGYLAACEAIVHSEPLRRVLEVALELGNTFNEQQAFGARLGSLLELSLIHI